MDVIPTLVVTRQGGALPDAITSDGTPIMVEDNDGNVVVEVTNDTGGSASVSFVPTATVAGMSFSDEVIVLDDGDVLWAGPWPPVLFNDGTDNVVVNTDVGLTLRALRF